MEEAKKTPLLIRLTTETKESIQKIAQNRGVSVNGLISQILWQFVKDEQKK